MLSFVLVISPHCSVALLLVRVDYLTGRAALKGEGVKYTCYESNATSQIAFVKVEAQKNQIIPVEFVCGCVYFCERKKEVTTTPERTLFDRGRVFAHHALHARTSDTN